MEYNFFNLKSNFSTNALYFKKNDRKVSLGKNVGLTIYNPGILNIFNIRGNFKNPYYSSLMKSNFQIKVSKKIGSFENKNRNYLLNIGPDEMLLITETIKKEIIKKLEKSLIKNKFSFTEVSDNYQALVLSGKDVRWILSKGSPINFDEKNFTPGKCFQTHLSHSNVILFCNEVNSFTLICVSSFSEYVLEWLKQSSIEHGYNYIN